ncbi:helix-turn-helix domain-containing protein [Promicromonospora iranensis]|uniref:AcrR family transcriptional regulator n=1 Tax=Promicromonospora iranensis TaxID=1105144 RepID=A0ABU2CMC2_9MICO|nr:helix-turn-helix domain-containing protein [Promicromonospora iranensis]MDR7382426.1 AcrR family transcriptional regulator [Promicromonospora iranensis]
MTGVLRDPRRGDVPRVPARREGAPNLGPRAAAGNRAALLAAAREVFGSDGTGAPLSAVAKRAGVGQGSLYRHFPERVDLVVAVFEEQVVAVEELAQAPGVGLPELLGLVTRHAVDSVGFVDLVRSGVPDGRLSGLAERVAGALGTRLPDATASGAVPPGTTPDDLLLAVSMVVGGLSGVGAADRTSRATRAWELLGIEVRIPDAPA